MSPRASSLLDVATAPPGMALEDGVWFTHDLDMQLVADHIAPLLTGQMVRDVSERRRRAAAFEFSGNEGGVPRLLVVSDGRRMSGGPAVRWVRLVPVHGRVQHAKFGLLLFRSTDGSRRRVRAFVSSANLTRGGSTSNLEFLVVEDRQKGGTVRSLGGDLARALHDFVLFAERSPGDVRASDSADLRSVWHQFVRVVGKPAGLVVHSLDQQRPLLPASSTAADRVDIVSPAFAAPSDAGVVDQLLSSYLAPETTVRWHIGGDADGHVRVPKAAWTALRGAASSSIYVVRGAEERARPLHAKLVAITRGGTVVATGGSANFTTRGLGGRNRELVIRWSSPARRWTLIDELGSVPLVERPRFTTRNAVESSDRTVVLPVVSAVAVTPDEHGTLWGYLEIDTSGVPAGFSVHAKVAGRWRSVAELRSMHVPLGAALVAMRLTSPSGDTTTVDVPVDLSATPPDAWLIRSDRELETDPELGELLDMIRRTASRTPGTTTGRSERSGVAGPGVDDKYLQRLSQPLVLLARHRNALWEAETTEALERTVARLGEALDKHRWDPAVEARIARVLLDLPRPKGSKLLQALRKVAG